MNKFQIWCEGFSDKGVITSARCLGIYIGFDFRDAVCRYYERNPSNIFDPVYLTDFYCHLFPTEEEARKKYG